MGNKDFHVVLQSAEETVRGSSVCTRLQYLMSNSIVTMQPENTEEINDKKILIVEDDLINARVFSKILERWWGYSTLHTENVEQILSLAESGIIEVILMDVSLSRSVYQGEPVSGIKITQMLKSNPKTASIPIILVTAHAMEGDRKHFLKQSGANSYISKPIVDHLDFGIQIMNIISSSGKDRFHKHLQAQEWSIRALIEKINSLKDELKIAHKRIKELEKQLDKYSGFYLNRIQIGLMQFLWSGISIAQNCILFNLKLIYTKIQPSLSESDALDLVEKQPVLVDISEQQDISYQTNEAYKLICSDVVHSLKGEFLNIGGSNEEIRYLSNKSPEILEECELIQRSLEYSYIRLQKLMDYLNLGKSRVETIKIEKLIAEVESLSRPRLPSNIDMKVQVQGKLKGRTILGNSDQIKSILLELIRNSTKALQEPDGVIQILAGCEDGNLITMSIKDNGSGISDDLKNKLLKETVKSDSGLGIGLYLANRIIHQMGGNLKLESSENGTIITLIFTESNTA